MYLIRRKGQSKLSLKHLEDDVNANYFSGMVNTPFGPAEKKEK